MFNCQLANTYNPIKNYGVSHWYSSPKYDGVRCLYIPDQGLMSRTLKTKYVGFPEIEAICANITPGFTIDGELYIPNEAFDKISGIIRKSKKYEITQKQRVQFHVFALWKPDYTFVNTELMVESISEEIPNNQSFVVPIPYTLIENNPLAIQAQNQFNKENSGTQEGTVLRHPDVAYYQGRSQNLLKVKNVANTIFTITGFYKGTGKYSKSLGKLSVSGLINGITVTSKVGTGFTDAQRQEIWNNQSDYLGTGAEIIYMGVTASGSLRQPVFSRFSWEVN